jgi:Meiotically up-regulated gene 113
VALEGGIRAGFVYVIGPAEPVKPYRVKIGKADSVTARRRALQVGSPFRLEILHIIQADDPFRLERDLHAELAEFHCHGEWFQMGDDPRSATELVKEAVRALKDDASRGRSEARAAKR